MSGHGDIIINVSMVSGRIAGKMSDLIAKQRTAGSSEQRYGTVV